MGSMEAARWAGATAAQPETTIIAAPANTKLTGWRARIVGDHADGRARSIDQRVSNCRATWLLAQVVETTPHTLSTGLDRCAPVTAYGAERPISDGRVGGDASPWQAPQAKRNLPLAAMSEDYYPEVGHGSEMPAGGVRSGWPVHLDRLVQWPLNKIKRAISKGFCQRTMWTKAHSA